MSDTHAPGRGWRLLDLLVVFCVGALLGLLLTTVIRGGRQTAPAQEES